MRTKNILKIFLLLNIFLFSGCETVDLDGLKNPNEIGLEYMDPIYGFNYIQVTLPRFIDAANDFTQQVTRQMAMTSGKTYDNAFESNDSNTNWRLAYTMLQTIKLMEPLAKSKSQMHLLGATKIIRAYILFTLVDLYGDVPYSEALLGNENLNPKFDKGADVYKVALKELDEAIVMLNGGAIGFQGTDLYYGTGLELILSKEKWRALANSLKLRALVTARKNGAAIGVNINADLTTLMSADLIDTAAEDFAFKYSTNNETFPSSRHPLFDISYTSSISPPYISNYMLWTMVREKSTGSTAPAQADANLLDPRTKYYFYNQSTDVYKNDTFTLPTKFTARPDHYNSSEYASFFVSNRLSPFSYVKTALSNESPWWGADHGNFTGRPQDGDKITIVGLYPAGGKFGGGSSPQTSNASAGQKGAGIMPILMSSFVRFLKAEAYSTVFSDPVNAKIEMDLAINASINKASTLFPTFVQPTPSEISSFLTYVGNFYNNNTNKQLELIMKEYFIAAWGNGIETYNNYRRTGFPSNMQPTIEPYSGVYYSTMLYPSDSQANNSNRPDNVRTRKTFWDVNSPILH